MRLQDHASDRALNQQTLGHIDRPACEGAPLLSARVSSSPSLPVLFSEWIDQAEKHHEKHSSKKHAYDFGRKFIRIRRQFATMPATAMTRAVVQEWLEDMADEQEWGPAAYNRFHSCFSSIFQLANRDNDDFYNPMTKVPRKKEYGKERYWSEDEEGAIIAATKKRYPGFEDIFILAIEVGYRKSEQLRAQIGDYNPATYKIAIHQRKNKSAGLVRYVPLSDRGIAAYERLCVGRRIGEPLIVQSEHPWRDAGAMKDTRWWFDKALQDAGITDPAASWHVCRHTFCSRLCAKGVPLPDVQIYAGHTDIRTTMRYTHAIEGENDVRARAAMNGRGSQAQPTLADLQATIAGLAAQIANLQPIHQAPPKFGPASDRGLRHFFGERRAS